jgi:very-short-patch-repair endonuclease
VPISDRPIATRRAAWITAKWSLADDPDLAPAHAFALRHGFVLTRAQARRAGVSDARIRSLLRRRIWWQPRRGVLCVLPTAPDALSAAIAGSAAHLVHPQSAISHASAAAAHGLPLLQTPRRPTLTGAPGGPSNTRDNIDLHAAALHGDDTAHWFGQRITAIARTAVDVARNLGVAAGVVAMDAALHEHVTSDTELDRVVADQEGWPYVRRARRAVALSDAGSESVLETLVRVRLTLAGVTRPELQARIETAGGSYRVDMLWRRERVILEADGLDKYRAGWQTLVDEKRRQENLERAGYRVIRVTWRELMQQPDDVVRRVRAALGR